MVSNNIALPCLTTFISMNCTKTEENMAYCNIFIASAVFRFVSLVCTGADLIQMFKYYLKSWSLKRFTFYFFSPGKPLSEKPCEEVGKTINETKMLTFDPFKRKKTA